MTRIKTIKELDEFCDNSMFCICGRLMTGLHMDGCSKLNNLKKKLEVKDEK
ncbi:MAG: hypothetical protein AABY22_05605 [Nanoarchaeota archaeon]